MTLSLFTLLGCQSEQPISTLPPVLVLETYKSTGELIAKKSVASEDLLHKRLTTLLLQDGATWQSNMANYAAVRYVFRSEAFIVRCLTDKIIIDVKDKNGWKSYEKLEPNLLARLGFE